MFVREISGHYPNPGYVAEVNVDYVYATDQNISAVTSFTRSTNGTYYFSYVATKVGASSPFSTIVWKFVRTGTGSGGNTGILYAGPSVSGPFTDMGPYPDILNLVTAFGMAGRFAQYPNADAIENAAGTYNVTEQVWTDGNTPPTPSSIGNFDIRVLSIKNLKANKNRVNPVSRNNTTTIQGDWVALPAGANSSLYTSGWAPTSSIGWDLQIVDPLSNLVREFTGSSSVGTPNSTTGKVGEFQQVWNLKDSSGEILEGIFLFANQANASVPSLGSTSALVKVSEVLSSRCSCADGQSRLSISRSPVKSAVGPGLAIAMNYNGQDPLAAPGSMGYGWFSNSSIRVFEDSISGDLVYQDESGQSLRWTNSSGTYIPYHKDNYSEAVKTLSNPNYVYALTFQDRSRREFDVNGKILREVDRKGNTLSFSYGTGGVLTTMTDARGRTLHYDYGTRTDGQPISVRANNATTGRQTLFGYYSSSHATSPDRLMSITENITTANPAGETTTFVYDAAGQIFQILDIQNRVAVEYTYDSLGRKLSEQHYDQMILFYDYLESSGYPGVMTTEIDLTSASPDKVRVSFYDNHFNIVEVDEVVEPVTPTVNQTFMEYTDTLNPYLVTQSTSPNGAVTQMSYNAQGQLSTQTNAQGRVTRYEYADDIDTPLNPNHRNLLRKIHRAQVTVNGVLTTYNPTEFQYDSDGALVKIIDAKSHSIDIVLFSNGLVDHITDRRGFVTSFTYLSDGNLETVTTPAGPAGAPSRTTTMAYHPYDNLASATDPLSNSVNWDFGDDDRLSKVTDARGKYVLMNYVNGLLDTLEAPTNAGSGSNRRTTAYSYDGSDRLVQVDSQTNASTYQTRVGYGYDGFSNLRQLARLKDATVKTTDYTFDALGRLINTNDFAGNDTSIEHEPFCVQNRVTTARGVKQTSYFDNLCRLTERETQDERHLFQYDELDRLIAVTVGPRYGWNDPALVGAVYHKAAYAHTTRYLYDELDRVTVVTFPNGEQSSYLYDDEGNVLQVDTPNNRTSLYSYYNDGRLYQVTYRRPGQTDQVFTYLYDAAGRLDSVTFPTSTNMVASFTKTDNTTGWNQNGQLVALRYLKGGSHFHRFEYSYDDSGNRTRMIDTPLNTANAVTWDYSYDWFNRLTNVSRNSVSTAVYGYDESDNRVSCSFPVAGEAWTYALDLADRIQSRSVSISGGPVTLVESFTHDLDGNMTSRTLASTGQVTTYDWNTLDKLRQRAVNGTVQETNSYDAEGIRRLKKDNISGDKTKYFSSGGMSLSDKLPTGDVSFIQGHQVLGMEQAGNLYYYLSDGLGSVRVIFNASGNEAASASYSEFGKAENVSDPNGLMFHGYTGALGVRNETAGSGLLYMRQRWYDSVLGRWLTEDPIGFAGGLNVYAYVSNSPLDRTDPKGLDSLPPGWSMTTDLTGTHEYTNIIPYPRFPFDGSSRASGSGNSSGSVGGPPIHACRSMQSSGGGRLALPVSGRFDNGIPPCPPWVKVTDNMKKARRMSETDKGHKWFYKMVRNRGPWDYKQLDPNFQDFGNFHFGAVGHAFGFSDEVLLRMAGWAQRKAGTSNPKWGVPWGGPPYGDDPNDQIQIKRGIQYAREWESSIGIDARQPGRI